MAELHSTCLKNKLLDSASLKSIFGPSGVTGGSELRFYAGPTSPTGADMPAVGSVIVTVQQGGTAIEWAAAAVNGVLSKGTTAWEGTCGATGTAVYYRLVWNTDDNGDDSTNKVFPRIQGPCQTGGGEGMNMSSTTIGVGTFVVNLYSQSLL